MKKTREFAPFFGVLGLIVLFFKLPETPNPLGLFGCKTCISEDPYIALIGSFYFAFLVSLSLLFSSFPSPTLAKSGLVFSVTLAFALTFLNYPSFCFSCLIAHGLHVLIWLIWLLIPEKELFKETRFKEKISLSIFGSFSVVALYGCLNLTFLIYKLKEQARPSMSLKEGELAPNVALKAFNEPLRSLRNTVINFVTPGCVFCEKQLALLEEMTDLSTHYRFFHVTTNLEEGSKKVKDNWEWVEDKEGSIRKEFQVRRFPILFVIDEHGKIGKVFQGVQDNFKEDFIKTLKTKGDSKEKSFS